MGGVVEWRRVGMVEWGWLRRRELVQTRDGPDWSGLVGLVGLVADAVMLCYRAPLLQPPTSKHTLWIVAGQTGKKKKKVHDQTRQRLFSGERIYMRYRAQMHGRARMACEIQCMHHAPCTMLINFLGDICS